MMPGRKAATASIITSAAFRYPCAAHDRAWHVDERPLIANAVILAPPAHDISR